MKYLIYLIILIDYFLEVILIEEIETELVDNYDEYEDVLDIE